MSQYVVVYLGGDEPSSPEEGQQHFAKYQVWLSSLGDSVVSPANPFRNTNTVHPDGTVTTGSTTAMSGYTIIEAESMEAALSMAKACPFLDIGGSLEVSELVQMVTSTTTENPMLSLLRGEPPDPEGSESSALFDQFVGSWELDVWFFDGGTESRTTGEWHFDWILQGRALQEVLIFPALPPAQAVAGAEHRIGTCVRFYDRDARTWRVVWISPSSGTMYKLTGGKVGEDIVLEGDPHDGEPTRWIFSEIAGSSFLWRGLVSEDDGETWNLIQEMRATRKE